MENEVYRRLVEARAAHARLKDEVAACERESAEAEQVIEELSLKQAKVDELRRKAQVKDELFEKQRAENSELRRQLEESKGLSRLLEEALREKDLAAVLESVAVQRAESLKSELEEARIANTRLHNKCTGLEESLAFANSRVAHLESDAYKSSIVDDYHLGSMGKVEVALECKAGYDYLAAQLPSELREAPDQFHYPPSIAPFTSFLSAIEERGYGYEVEAGGSNEETDEGEMTAGETASGGDTGSTHGAEGSTHAGSSGGRGQAQSTPPSSPMP